MAEELDLIKIGRETEPCWLLQRLEKEFTQFRVTPDAEKHSGVTETKNIVWYGRGQCDL